MIVSAKFLSFRPLCPNLPQDLVPVVEVVGIMTKPLSGGHLSDRCAIMSDMAGTRISVRIDADLQQWLSQEGTVTGKKPSDIVREALADRRQRPPVKRTLYDAFSRGGACRSDKGRSAGPEH